MAATGSTQVTAADYLQQLRRHWWLTLIVASAGVLAAQALLTVLPPQYASTVAILVQPTSQDTNVVGGRTQTAINLDTEAQVLRSDAVVGAAAASLGGNTSARRLSEQIAVEVPANTSILRVTVTGGTAASAMDRAKAIATAYLNNRTAIEKNQRDLRATVLSHRMRLLNIALAAANRKLAAVAKTNPNREQYASERQSLVGQLNRLAERQNQLSISTAQVGRVLAEPAVPTAPTSPNPRLFLASGALLGLVLGLLAAAVRERLGRRLRDAADVRRYGRAPVLAAWGRESTPAGVASANGADGRAFHRLRNEILAEIGCLNPVLAVVAAADEPGGTMVAVNTAIALARTGDPVTVVSAGGPAADARLRELLGLDQRAGVAELTAGLITADRVLQQAPAIPGLQVVTAGKLPGEPLAGPLRTVLRELASRYGLVVVLAGAANAGAQAQSVAAMVDATLLVTTARRTRRADLTDAEDQLLAVGAHLLGTVVLPAASAAPVRPRAPRQPEPTPQTQEQAQLQPATVGAGRANGR